MWDREFRVARFERGKRGRTPQGPCQCTETGVAQKEKIKAYELRVIRKKTSRREAKEGLEVLFG